MMDRRRRSFTTIIPERNSVICSNDRTAADDFVFFFRILFSQTDYTPSRHHYITISAGAFECVWEWWGGDCGIVQHSLCHRHLLNIYYNLMWNSYRLKVLQNIKSGQVKMKTIVDWSYSQVKSTLRELDYNLI